MLTDAGAICVGEEYPNAEVCYIPRTYSAVTVDSSDYRKRFERHPINLVC